jgi:hypothetical protein
VCSHARRVALNAQLQDIYKQPGAILVNPERSTARKNVPQTMWIWVGQQLICASRLKNLRNQATYVVEELTETHAVVALGDERHRFALPRVAELFRLPFARTYHSAQGLGFDRVRLWDCESRFFTKEHLVTGLSRCRSSAALDFGAL